MSRFHIVANPIKALLGNTDPVDPVVVEQYVKRLVKCKEARDVIWDKRKDCPEKLQVIIENTEKWLEVNGYWCMEDMSADFGKVIDDHFWELMS